MRLKCSHNHRETPLYLLVTNILVLLSHPVLDGDNRYCS
uniref:Uncharacterized protein n=1 Tax=Myoviridae sp. ct3wi9 TaxID=2826610 RepID=A0A8S5MW73_9CAUD|nr:MAG TPA: hypothetical protein [Myoviridae sp. ct3wi9]DAP00555.1 MAG TPA: hypothetical protein [Caudoviricetes sp.]DAQ08146.1 MAG TPA: hypothetical protein [Caudoviricetes sp.]DAQ87363.1 MAG TPA: hypothetical protein [Caudoviricetes sp.]DAT79218.1 MAG TPA: hypothetical protein [Caudoviricetes sp.]